jgi:hypothetical protein
LDPSDLVRGGLVVEQQHDQALHRLQALEPVTAGELVAGPGGKQPALAVVEEDRGGGGGAVADAGDQLSGSHQHRGEPFDSLFGDVAARVGRELELVERDPLDRALDVLGGDRGHVEQRWGGQQGGVGSGGGGVGHSRSFHLG